MPQKISTCIWFNGKAEEAARFYVSIFKRSKILGVSRYGDSGPGKKGDAMLVTFRLEGQEFMILNGGPGFEHSWAMSLMVHCKDQKEVDALWRKLLKGGGKESRCGWLSDKYGVSWQIVPDALLRLQESKDPAKRERVMQAMMKMVKLDVRTLERAAAGA